MDASTIFIVGANGQLGKALQAKYPGAQSADIGELDITNPGSVANFDWSKVKIILNAAGYTNVDGAETADGRIAAWLVNATAVSYLVQAALEHDLTLVHISTDYVFDGTQDNHAEDEPFSPLSVYGQSKTAGDIAVSLAPKHYLLRTSWVIGDGPNFVRTMLGLGAKGVSPTVVADQVGRLTFTPDGRTLLFSSAANASTTSMSGYVAQLDAMSVSGGAVRVLSTVGSQPATLNVGY